MYIYCICTKTSPLTLSYRVGASPPAVSPSTPPPKKKRTTSLKTPALTLTLIYDLFLSLTVGTPAGDVCSHSHIFVIVTQPAWALSPRACATVTNEPPTPVSSNSCTNDNAALSLQTCFAGTGVGGTPGDPGSSPATSTAATVGALVGTDPLAPAAEEEGRDVGGTKGWGVVGTNG